MKTIPLLEPVAGELLQVESKLHESLHPEYPALAGVLRQLLDSGGKRLRPALAILAGRVYAAPSDKLVSLAASVEMLHTATLVHDDLVDASLLRRGNPTLNASYSPAVTVLAGDYLFARSASLAAETENVQVMAIFARTLMTICSGELRQIFDRHTLPRVGTPSDWEAALQSYDERIHAKTASLFAAATEAAAVLGTAPEDETNALRNYGHLLGMGFQIMDDVLDLQGQEELLGKPVGSDLREGIVTLPVLFYLRAHPQDQRVASIVRDSSDDRLVRDVAAAVCASDAIRQSMQRARTFIAQSQQTLAVLPEGKPRSVLHALAEYTASRET